MANLVKYHIIGSPVFVNLDNVNFILGNKIVFQDNNSIKVDENINEVIKASNESGKVLSSKSR